MKRARILVVDDKESFLALFRRIAPSDVEVVCISDGARAFELLSAEHLMTAMIGGWPPPEQFAHRIRRHTSPTSSDTHVFLATYVADGEPGQHLVNVADLDPLPDRVRILATEELPISLQILIATRVGALAPGHRKTHSVLASWSVNATSGVIDWFLVK